MTISSPSIYLGIDTGGTFTDGVLFDPQSRDVIKSKKVLTTHHDLKICISQVLEDLIPDNPGVISFVSLSTTLATNAIAEGKRKPVALLLLGYDPELVHQFKFHEQFGTEYYFFIQGRHDLNGIEQVPLDQAEVKRIAAIIQGKVDAFAVSSYSGPANSSHEKRAAEIITELTALPVVQAHHLSSELDSIRRATTASINASLLSNLHEFLDAVHQMLADHGIECPIMVVRGDGSLVKADFARHRPVEMIYSGPAASAIGGQYLAGIDTALVIDMGGTTTDIALVDQGNIPHQENAAVVGFYRTCVKTIKARSFGLGGDSLIAFDHGQNLTIGPDRVVPISHLCSQYPDIKQELLDWLYHRNEVRYSDELEYWILRREPKQRIDDKTVRGIIGLLQKGPQRLWDLNKRIKPVPTLLIRELVDQEIIDRAGLTPTDLLHITGEFSLWDDEVVKIVTDLVARNWGESASAFIQRVRKTMTLKITAEILQFLSDKLLSEPGYGKDSQLLDRWLFEENLNRRNAFLGSSIFLKIPIVGIGAPSRAFLPPVAEALDTSIIFPDHYEVANAVGTVVGNVSIRLEGEVFPCVEGSAITGYYARTTNIQQKFERYEEALAFARETLTRQVALDAKVAGAETALVECDEKKIWDGMVHLSAWAIGEPGWNGKTGPS